MVVIFFQFGLGVSLRRVAVQSSPVMTGVQGRWLRMFTWDIFILVDDLMPKCLSCDQVPLTGNLFISVDGFVALV